MWIREVEGLPNRMGISGTADTAQSSRERKGSKSEQNPKKEPGQSKSNNVKKEREQRETLPFLSSAAWAR
jgi:hypothetical protein